MFLPSLPLFSSFLLEGSGRHRGKTDSINFLVKHMLICVLSFSNNMPNITYKLLIFEGKSCSLAMHQGSAWQVRSKQMSHLTSSPPGYKNQLKLDLGFGDLAGSSVLPFTDIVTSVTCTVSLNLLPLSQTRTLWIYMPECRWRCHGTASPVRPGDNIDITSLGWL